MIYFHFHIYEGTSQWILKLNSRKLIILPPARNSHAYVFQSILHFFFFEAGIKWDGCLSKVSTLHISVEDTDTKVKALEKSPLESLGATVLMILTVTAKLRLQ